MGSCDDADDPPPSTQGAVRRIRTPRLLLRGWTDGDRVPFARLNADPEVMAHFPAPLTRAQSDAFVDRIGEHFERHGFGAWAVELRSTGELIGFTGLSVPRFRSDWMDQREQPVVEVGWRLARPAWGQGYATEAARSVLDLAFDELGRREVVSFTVVGNRRSRAVMERLGMRELAHYDHPIPDGPSLPSIAYLVDAARYREQRTRGG
ncbi:MAG: GNAT family N-acetyltransferase [Nocardioidaceae bacterium]